MIRLTLADAKEWTDETLFSRSISQLGQKRQEKISALKLGKDQRLSLAAGLLLKDAFLEKYGEDYSEEIAIAEKGRPYLPNKQCYFSLSHSVEYALCGISNMPLGCDIEKERPCLPKGLSKLLSCEEIDYLEKLREKERLSFFFLLWTRKESFLKLIGTGIGFPIKEISFVQENKLQNTFFWQGMQYYFHSTAVGEYHVSVCTTKEISEIFIEKKVPIY